MILALEDYKIAAKLLPSKTDAMFEIGLFRFNNQWVILALLKRSTRILPMENQTAWVGYEIKLDKCVPNFSINGMLKKCPLFRDCPELFYLNFAFDIAPPGHWRDQSVFVDLVIIRALFFQNNSVVSFIIIILHCSLFPWSWGNHAAPPIL